MFKWLEKIFPIDFFVCVMIFQIKQGLLIWVIFIDWMIHRSEIWFSSSFIFFSLPRKTIILLLSSIDFWLRSSVQSLLSSIDWPSDIHHHCCFSFLEAVNHREENHDLSKNISFFCWYNNNSRPSTSNDYRISPKRNSFLRLDIEECQHINLSNKRKYSSIRCVDKKNSFVISLFSFLVDVVDYSWTVRSDSNIFSSDHNLNMRSLFLSPRKKSNTSSSSSQNIMSEVRRRRNDWIIMFKEMIKILCFICSFDRSNVR